MASPLFSAPAGGAAVVASRKKPAQVLQHLAALPKLAGVTAASRLEVRPAPEMVSSGIPEIDELAGGLPRGCLSEICGPASSGRTSVLLAALAAATRRQEVCALVDTTDALDAVSAAAAGVELEKLLWIRCADLGPRTSDLRLRAPDLRRRTSDSDLRAKFEVSQRSEDRGLRSEFRARRPTPALLNRHCASPICFCKAGALAWWPLILAMCRTRRRGGFRWLPGFAFSAPSNLPPRCYWWWPRRPALRLALLC